MQGAKNDIAAGADGGKMVLVPLTGSLYVPGRLVEEGGLVLVDVGTGFYVEKVCCAPYLSTVFLFLALCGVGNVYWM